MHRTLWIVGVSLLFVPALAFAQSPGQADLDKATDLKVSASSLEDLNQVIEHCELAIKKGLSKGDKQFAEQLLTATLLQHASQLVQPIFQEQPPNPNWPTLRKMALEDLDKISKLEALNGEGYLLVSRLETLPGGEKEKARAAAEKAVELFADNPEKLAGALLWKVNLTEDKAQRLADLSRMTEIAPNNPNIWRLRGAYFQQEGEYEKAEADFNRILDLDKENAVALLLLSENKFKQQKLDEALGFADRAIEAAADAPVAYRSRAQIHAAKNDLDQAEADLNRAIDLEPKDIASIMMRARLRQARKAPELAMADVDRVLELRPGLVDAIMLKSILFAAEKNFDKAVGEIQKLIKAAPKHAPFKMQLAAYYVADERPAKAIETFNEILAESEDFTVALRARGDAWLSMGEQKKAIADYEAVLKKAEDDPSTLNNLAWVLATSPDAAIRNADRAIELATKACEKVEFKQPHIVSTLAAAYAEKGDFETAIKWSNEAIKLAPEEGELKDQVTKELASYKEKKPWREIKSVEAKEEPAGPSDDDLNFD